MDHKIINMLDTVMRIPPLFVMDEVLKWSGDGESTSSFNIRNLYTNIVDENHPLYNDHSYVAEEVDDIWQPHSTENFTGQSDTNFSYQDDFLHMWLPVLFKLCFCIIVYMIATVVFLLSWNRLVQVYMLIGSICVIFCSYHANILTAQFVISPSNIFKSSLLHTFLSMNTTDLWNNGSVVIVISMNYFLQSILSVVYTSLHLGNQSPVLKYIIMISFLLPTSCLILPLPTEIQSTIPVFTALVPLAVIKYVITTNLFKCFAIIIEGYKYAQMILNFYGLHSLLESEWIRLNVPNVLRTFWITQVARHLAVLLGEYMYIHGEYKSIWMLDFSTALIIIKAIMTQGCETTIAILGMTSIVSYICHYIGLLFQFILMADEDEERSLGTVCAILFFVLAEQSGLTVLEPEKRFVRLCRNFCLLLTAMLHFIHNMVNPILMSLSASRNPTFYRHVRALFVCFLLISLPVTLLVLLWMYYPLSTWLLAVSAFSIQVIVKTIVSLLIYILFLIDAYCSTFWEKLDDYVYYIRAFGNSVEFIFGILLFFNGAWIYLFESGGSIRALMMCIHAYFNIWCEAKNGWSVFIKRKTAVNKIDSLPEATNIELQRHNDVCAICFQDLNSARITKCKHYFHSVCLRKWLYVQDSCPLCHKTLYKTDIIETNESSTNTDPENDRQNLNTEETDDAEGNNSGVDSDVQESSFSNLESFEHESNNEQSEESTSEM